VTCQTNTHPSKPDSTNLPVVELQESHEPIKEFENIKEKIKKQTNKKKSPPKDKINLSSVVTAGIMSVC